MTPATHEIVEWGHVPFIPKLPRQNPLTFWNYYDRYTNRDEKLSRLRELLLSSHVGTNQFCEVCSEAAGAGDAVGPQSDVLTFFLRWWQRQTCGGAQEALP